MQQDIEIKRTQQTTTGRQTMISLRDIGRTYSTKGHADVAALQHLDLSIYDGELVAITGPSGSGKSTLLQLIGGLDRPTTGSVVVDGQEVHKLHGAQLAAYRNKTVGFIFQFFYLQPFLTVAANVEIPLMFAQYPRHRRQQLISEALQSVGLADKADALPQQLSGGQIQRVAIARALINQPKLILADEPTGNLDSKNSDSIMNLLTSIRETRGTTIVIVTHDSGVAARADRSIAIADGRIA